MSTLQLATLSCASLDEARRLGKGAVEAGIVACVSLVPWVESYYRWNGELRAQQETKVVFKLPQNNQELLKEYVLGNSSYEVPELLFLDISNSLPLYENWAIESCYGNVKSESV